MNGTNASVNPRFACGISGSGPTMYVLSNSRANAQLICIEAQKALKKEKIFSWSFVHSPNSNGAEIIGLL
jgi:homoserine kinase